MSRIRILGASLVVLAAGIGGATAADLPAATPPPSSPIFSPTPAYSWNGAYAGLFGGYNWGRATTSAPAGTATVKGLNGGLYAGYNFQTPNNFVLGAEGDLYLNAQKGSIGGLTVSNPWGGTIRARAGYAFNRFMVYGTGGLAFGSIKGTSGGATDTAFKTGWTVGAGLEAAITSHVTARVEYRYTDFATASLATNPASTVDLKSSAVLLGVGVKF